MMAWIGQHLALFLFLILALALFTGLPVAFVLGGIGIFFGVTLLNDQLTARMLAGGAVTLIGVLIVVLREKRIVDTGT